MKTLIIFNSENERSKNFIPLITKTYNSAGIDTDICDPSAVSFDMRPDFITVLGGDGSIMRSAKQASLYDIPVIGINFGRIGYLASVEPDECALLEKIASGNYTVDQAMMLEIEYDGKIYYALNDGVIANGTVSRMASLELECDGSPIGSYHADGLIAATPIGSTAYSMSAGGPVVDPSMKCILITPVCSHLILSRPIVFSDRSELVIRNSGTRGQVYLTVDGSENIAIGTGDSVKISKAERNVKFIRLKQDGFYERLRKVQDKGL